MENPLVSVCIPAYNNADYILDTINSILNQSYKNIELIIVDDNSLDDTLEVVKSVQDERIKVYHNDKNLGMSGNWNRCLELCTGEFVKLICADDIIATNAIEKEVEALVSNQSATLVCSDTKLVDLNGNGKGFYKRYRKSGLVDGKEVCRKGFLVKDYFGAPQANTFRRSVAEKIGGFDTYFTYILDYDFFVSLACEGDVYIIHESLNYFRVRKGSNTGAVMGGDKNKTKIYVDEHRHLLMKNKDVLNMSDSYINLSVLIRKFRCFAASIYLKVFVHK